MSLDIPHPSKNNPSVWLNASSVTLEVWGRITFAPVCSPLGLPAVLPVFHYNEQWLRALASTVKPLNDYMSLESDGPSRSRVYAVAQLLVLGLSSLPELAKPRFDGIWGSAWGPKSLPGFGLLYSVTFFFWTTPRLEICLVMGKRPRFVLLSNSNCFVSDCKT